MIDCINSKAVNSTIHPECQNLLHFLSYRWISVVQIGLFCQELMKVTFVSFFSVRPSSRVKDGDPVIRILSHSINHWTIHPYVEIVKSFCPIKRLQKPFMFITFKKINQNCIKLNFYKIFFTPRMIWYEIKDDLQSQLFCLTE